MSKRLLSFGVLILFATILPQYVLAFPPGHAERVMSGPWELLVKLGMDRDGMIFKVAVSDESKVEELNRVLPIIGVPIEIKLAQYVPDLKWETTTVENKEGNIIAKLNIEGENLKQELWLNSDDPAKRSMSSSIGGVVIRKLYRADSIKKLEEAIGQSQPLGMVLVWPPEQQIPLEYVVNMGQTVELPNSNYKLSFLEYVPHYSIDIETRKVVTQSQKPVNPAMKVSLDNGEKVYEQWLWSKFPSSPHAKKKLPLRMEFIDFDISSLEGQYILLAASSSQSLLVFAKDGKVRTEKVQAGKKYPFSNKEYSFSIERVVESADIKTNWKNESNELKHPAIIAEIKDGDSEEQAVLEFNKPYHKRTKIGTVVILYRCQNTR